MSFLTICVSIYAIIYGQTKAVFVTVTGVFLFAFFIVKYVNLQRKKELVFAKLEINKTEIEVLKRNFHSLETGKEFINPAHYYSNDIDLFGLGSFFQFINRTATFDGKIELAKKFTENSVEDIFEKQRGKKPSIEIKIAGERRRTTKEILNQKITNE